MLQPASSRFALHSTTPIYSLALLDSRQQVPMFTVHYLRWRMPPFMRQCLCVDYLYIYTAQLLVPVFL